MNIFEKLTEIQNELKVPKSQFNSFGNYHYRSAEDILEAAKPICKEHKTTLFVSDVVEAIGERWYVKATATLVDNEATETTNKEFRVISVSAYAREDEVKKGMDGSQITGAASSYARKYALNGLFDIDDTKDGDATNNENNQSYGVSAKVKKQNAKQVEQKTPTASDSPIDEALKKEIIAIGRSKNYGSEAINKWCRLKFGKDTIDDLTQAEGFTLKSSVKAAQVNA